MTAPTLRTPRPAKLLGRHGAHRELPPRTPADRRTLAVIVAVPAALYVLALVALLWLVNDTVHGAVDTAGAIVGTVL